MREERDLPNDIPDDKKSPDTKTSDSGILRSEIRGRTELATCPSSSKFSSEFGSALERVIETGGRFKRLWLIRHFDYEDSPEANAYRKASERDKSLMSQSEIDSLNEIGKNVRANVDDPQIQRALRAAFRKRPDGTKMVLFSDFDESIMVRNRMTMEWVERDPSTRGSFVSERTKLSVPKMSDGGKKTYDAFIQTKTVIGTWGKGTEDGTMLGNRTFAHPFGLRIGRPCDTEKDATARLERDGYDFWDVEKGESGKPIIPDGKTLRITPDNAPGLGKILADACTDQELKLRISQAFDELPLVMLQEAANDALSKLRTTDRTAFNTALRALCAWKDDEGNPDAELQSYAFERLVELGAPWGELLETEWSSGALEWMATKRHREFVIRYYGESERGPVDNVGPFAKSMNVKGMKNLFDEAYEYWKVRRKQKRSVDPMVRNGIPGAILDRQVRLVGGDGPMGSLEAYEAMLEKIKSLGCVINGDVGTGKSLWLGEFAKYAILKGTPLKYYEAKDLEIEWFEIGGEIRDAFDLSDGTVFCFDGIDEISDIQKRESIKRLIRNLGSRTVVATRPGEYSNEDKDICFVTLSPLDSKTFIDSRLSDSEKKSAALASLKSGGLANEVEGNPLLLSLVCILSETESSEAEKLTRWSISPLSKMRTKSAIYEGVARFVLASHMQNSRGTTVTKKLLESRMDELSEYAFAIRNGNPTEGFDEDFDAFLSLLGRTGMDREYRFIHESFYEFFLARNLARRESGIAEIERIRKDCFASDDTFGRSAGNWRKWRSFKPVFKGYAEIVSENNEGGFLEFVSMISSEENDDRFGTGYFYALELLHSVCMTNASPLFAQKKSELETRIGTWGDEETVWKIPNLQRFMKIAGYPEIQEIDERVLPFLESMNGRTLSELVVEKEIETVLPGRLKRQKTAPLRGYFKLGGLGWPIWTAVFDGKGKMGEGATYLDMYLLGTKRSKEMASECFTQSRFSKSNKGKSVGAMREELIKRMARNGEVPDLPHEEIPFFFNHFLMNDVAKESKVSSSEMLLTATRKWKNDPEIRQRIISQCLGQLRWIRRGRQPGAAKKELPFIEALAILGIRVDDYVGSNGHYIDPKKIPELAETPAEREKRMKNTPVFPAGFTTRDIWMNKPYEAFGPSYLSLVSSGLGLDKDELEAWMEADLGTISIPLVKFLKDGDLLRALCVSHEMQNLLDIGY